MNSAEATSLGGFIVTALGGAASFATARGALRATSILQDVRAELEVRVALMKANPVGKDLDVFLLDRVVHRNLHTYEDSRALNPTRMFIAICMTILLATEASLFITAGGSGALSVELAVGLIALVSLLTVFFGIWVPEKSARADTVKLNPDGTCKRCDDQENPPTRGKRENLHRAVLGPKKAAQSTEK